MLKGFISRYAQVDFPDVFPPPGDQTPIDFSPEQKWGAVFSYVTGSTFQSCDQKWRRLYRIHASFDNRGGKSLFADRASAVRYFARTYQQNCLALDLSYEQQSVARWWFLDRLQNTISYQHIPYHLFQTCLLIAGAHPKALRNLFEGKGGYRFNTVRAITEIRSWGVKAWAVYLRNRTRWVGNQPGRIPGEFLKILDPYLSALQGGVPRGTMVYVVYNVLRAAYCRGKCRRISKPEVARWFDASTVVGRRYKDIGDRIIHQVKCREVAER